MSAIFISYRREDSEDAARALYESLIQRFGRDQLFMDVEGIALGSDFRQAIERSLSNCGVFLAMIGPDWLTAMAPDGPPGQRRIDNPNDFVRQEVATALGKGDVLPVIPVLVRGATMPTAEQLPDNLKPLAYRNALTLSHLDWDGSVNRLVEGIRPHLQSPAGSQARPPQTVKTEERPQKVAVPEATRSRSTLLFAGIAIALIAVAAGVYFLRRDGGTATAQVSCTVLRNPNLGNLPGPVDVYIDEQQIGQIRADSNGSTPLTFQASAGEHRFRFVDEQRHASCNGTFSVSASQARFVPRMRAGGTQCALDAAMR